MRAVKTTHPRGTAAAWNEPISRTRKREAQASAGRGSWWVTAPAEGFTATADKLFARATSEGLACVTSPDGRCDRDG